MKNLNCKNIFCVTAAVLYLWIGSDTVFGADLVWQSSKETAVSMAASQGKKILLVSGRDSCGNCLYMKYTACESLSPPIKSLIEQHYVPWFCDIDNSEEWYEYASGLGNFSLPLICVIDPHDNNNFLDRTTGIQDLEAFHSRLLQHASSLEEDPSTPDEVIISQKDYHNGDQLIVTLPPLPAGNRQYVAIQLPDQALYFLTDLNTAFSYNPTAFPVWQGGDVVLDIALLTQPFRSTLPFGTYTVYLLRIPQEAGDPLLNPDKWKLGISTFTIND